MNIVCSVCIANYNGIGLIDACIASVRAQDCTFSIEIIVHDDASTDGSAEHLRRNHPDVHLIESEENVGFCVANNRMVDHALGRYVLLLNNDAMLLPDALTVLFREAKILNRPAVLSLPQYDAETGKLLDIGSLLDPFLNPVPNLDPARNEVGTVAGACLWISKDLWQELGGFPEWFGSMSEDLYLCCRARLSGYPVRALGISGYRHWVGASFGGGKARDGRLVTTFRRRALSERNKTFVMALTYPTPAMQLLLPLHLLLLLVEGALLSILRLRLTYLTDIYFPVFRDLVRNRGSVLRERRASMQRRAVGVFGFFSAFGAMPHKLRMLIGYGLPHVR
jgi:GT2 family glycosyltransferase